MNGLSLFSGIGGLDLGLERAGITTVGQVEIDPWCRRVLAKHWPDVSRHGDVRTAADWWLSQERPTVDLVFGGFPCQDISTAGKRAGITGERSGLWSEFHNIIRVLRPRWVLLENVAAILGRGTGRVLGDLAEIGYDAEWDCVPAAAVGAPHLRDRWFAVAYPYSDSGWLQPVPVAGSSRAAVIGDDGPQGTVAYPPGDRLDPTRRRPNRLPGDACLGSEPADVADPMRSGWRTGSWEFDGMGSARRGAGRGAISDSSGSGLEGRRLRWTTPERSGWWTSEPDVGRVASRAASRVDRLRGLGNAVVPQVAEHVGRLIVAADRAVDVA